MLRRLQSHIAASPHLLVGLAPPDDAAVYQVTPDMAAVLTVDFFAPLVDDPYDFGAISAANAMSDVYAMGGEVALALNVAAFPEDMPEEVVARVLEGGADKVAEAGGVLAGGHTIIDREPKYGLCVLGFVHPQQVLTKAGARPGDRLVLTKPVGTGIVTTAAKNGEARLHHLRAAVGWMKALNRHAMHLARQLRAHAVTDVTGFGLMGHAWEMAEQSKVRLRIWASKVPVLPGALEYARRGIFPGGGHRNLSYYSPRVEVSPKVSEEVRLLMFDPQTSGGLLMAVPASLPSLPAGEHLWEIGDVVEGEGVELLP
mgnify:CR=1 FL=1